MKAITLPAWAATTAREIEFWTDAASTCKAPKKQNKGKGQANMVKDDVDGLIAVFSECNMVANQGSGGLTPKLPVMYVL
ncbi:hypothetical protein LINPERPRIM_LOCUS31375 [Linum perenne]